MHAVGDPEVFRSHEESIHLREQAHVNGQPVHQIPSLKLITSQDIVNEATMSFNLFSPSEPLLKVNILYKLIHEYLIAFTWSTEVKIVFMELNHLRGKSWRRRWWLLILCFQRYPNGSPRPLSNRFNDKAMK